MTETALTTALNASYMAERLAVFGLVVGVALLLSGIGFVILALAVFGRKEEKASTAAVVTPCLPQVDPGPREGLDRDELRPPGAGQEEAARAASSRSHP